MNAQNTALYKKLSYEMYEKGIKVYGNLADEYYKARTRKHHQFKDNTAEAVEFSKLAEKVNALGDNGKYITPLEMAEVYKDSAYVNKISGIFTKYMDTLEEMREEGKKYSDFMEGKEVDD